MHIKFVKIKIVYWFNNLIFKNIEYLLQYFTNSRIDDWNFDTFQISITLYVYNGNFKISSIFDNHDYVPRVYGGILAIVPGPSISHTSNETGWPVEGKTILNRFGYLNGPANTGSKKRSSSWTKHLWAARTCYTPLIRVFTLRFTRDFIDKGGRIDFKDRSIRATCCDDHRFRCD